MVKLDRIATRGGDGGETSLANGARVRKDHARIQVFGALDEANSAIGFLLAACADRDEMSNLLRRVQNHLFDLGADLATPGGRRSGPQIDERYAAYLDENLAIYNHRLQPLMTFVLPGGTEAACRAHLARTSVRRAERELVALSAEEAISPLLIPYLNRLSDLLFVLARVLNDDGRNDVLWVPAG
jgi:cob(I)alamin adenosyltransferase